jgi:hypothetical protein
MTMSVFIKGRKGVRKYKPVELSVSGGPGQHAVCLQVWEDGKSTHVFFADDAFIEEFNRRVAKHREYQAELDRRREYRDRRERELCQEPEDRAQGE